MFKKLALAAMAAVTTCAFAQSWNPSMDPSTMNSYEQKKMVMDQANAVLLGGDSYLMSNLLDRAPANISLALATTLSKNYYQSRIIGYEIAMSRFPVQTSYTTTTTNPDGTVTTTTTTTTDYSTTYAESMRPMRIIMQTPNPRNISYDAALDILTANLDQSEATQVRDWWWNSAAEQDKDVIIRFLRADTRYADQIIYPSTFPHSVITTSGSGG